MASSQQLIQALPDNSSNGRARDQALQLETLPDAASLTSLISYNSAGKLLIVGDDEARLRQAQALSPGLQSTLLLNKAASTSVARSAATDAKQQDKELLQGRVADISGYLGHFDVSLQAHDAIVSLAQTVFNGQGYFDLLLDLSSPSLLQRELPPPGYYAPGDDPAALQSALDEMGELVGEFEKPKYFHYDADICAHGRSGIQGCRRCLDVCPTAAISSIIDRVAVDPYLCQGGGSCAAVCPTGAIRYVYPDMRYLLERLRKTLQQYRQAGGVQPCLLFYRAEDGDALLASAMQLPDFVLPVEIEEIGALGMEAWFTALAYGASHILLWSTAPLAASVLQASEAQLEYAGAILQGMGYGCDRLQLLDGVSSEQLLDCLYALPQQVDIFPASFSVFEDKRTNLRLALDHLYRQASRPRGFVPLPAGAPFGEVQVDQQTCTLCMACVSQCPAGALLAGEQLPQLKFIEDKCIQCGLCARSCPEDAIAPSPRYLYDAGKRLQTRVIHEEQPFLCSVCGKPFATRKMVDKMAQKLSQHWMFKGQQDAMRRLQMCEDCRVKDLYQQETLLDVHSKV